MTLFYFSLYFTQVALGTTLGEIQIFDLDNGELVSSFQAHSEWINRLEQLSDHVLASASDDDTVKLWNITSCRHASVSRNNCTLLHTLTNHTNDVWSLTRVDADLLASGASDGLILVWQISTGRLVRQIDTGIGNGETVRCLQMLPNGLLASGDSRYNIKTWDVTGTGTQVSTFLDAHSGRVNDLLLLDEKRLASASSDDSIVVWNLTTQSRIFTLVGHEDTVRALTLIAPQVMASASNDKSVKLWNLTSGSLLFTLSNHSKEIGYALDTLRPEVLVSGSRDTRINV